MKAPVPVDPPMEIFIGNLPRYAAVSHLKLFFAAYGRNARFRILEKVLDTGEVIRFGHGFIEPDITAGHALHRLDGKALLGSPLLLRPYKARSEGDRRGGGRRERRHGGELRVSDERRLHGRFRPPQADWS